ncbi:MAG: LysR family transcriptional regulator, partial [Myxococcota bacterium]
MDLNDLSIFAAVAQAGSFSRAAGTLGVSPSHVSRRIAALEAHLDRRLVQRTTRAMALTPAGRAFHRRIGPLLDELDRATALVG